VLDQAGPVSHCSWPGRKEDAHLDIVDGEHLKVPRRQVHRPTKAAPCADTRRGRSLDPSPSPYRESVTERDACLLLV
jgi:hypothetical protein